MFINDKNIKLPEDPDTIVWKYLDLSKFVDLLLYRKLFLSRSDKFEDQYEGTFSEPTFEEIRKLSINNPAFLDYYKSHRENVVISSWHINEYESFAMWQIFTQKSEGLAIQSTVGRIQEALKAGAIAIVAGFQGVSQDTNDITTLGRGGSDTTAVALAAALEADVCEIYTDVDGIFSADPRVVPAAKKLSTVTYDEMLELAASGAKVLHLRCVEYARRYELPIHVRSSFSNKEGTWVVKDHPEGGEMEAAIIAGIAHDKSEAKVTIVGVPDRAGMAAAIFQAIADADINIDMIVQNVSAAATGLTDISFTLPKTEGADATAVLKRIQGEIGFASLQYDDQIGKLSLIGAGMRSHPGVTATFFACLSEAGVNIEMISTSEIRISIVCRSSDLDKGVKAAHTAFDLDADQIEAVVYGGSGR